MSFPREVFAIARKEIHLDLRFALQFFLQSITNPLAKLIPLIFVYTAILRGAEESPLPGVTIGTYLPFLILGTLFHTAWMSGAEVFHTKFIREKYWRTTELLFLAPIRTSAAIVGVGLSTIAYLIPTFLLFLGTILFVAPPSLSGLALTLMSLGLTYAFALSVGLIYGGMSLATENVTPFFQYGIAGLSLLSAFFYPLEALHELPEPLAALLVPLVRLNPLYAGVTFARAAWLGDPTLPWLDFLYLTAAVLVALPLALNTFRAVWRKFGVQG